MKKSINQLVLTSILLVSTLTLFSQEKNFIDQPYIEIIATMDTLISPDEIYLNIIIDEKDSRGRISLEEKEEKMIKALQKLKIPIETNLTIQDIASNFKKYVFRKKDIQKIKSYSLLVHDATTATKVILELESIGISNIYLDKLDYSNKEKLSLSLYTAAVAKAKRKGKAMLSVLNQKLGKAIYIVEGHNQKIRALEARSSGIVIRGYSSGSDYKNKEANLDIAIKKIKQEFKVSILFAIE